MPPNAPERGDDGDDVTGRAGDCHLPKDDVFHLLQNARRRAVLEYLSEQADPADVRTLAEEVAAREHGIPVEDLTSTQRQRVYIALYQSHLPKLDDLGVVEYDRQGGTVEGTGRAKQIQAYLDICRDARNQDTEAGVGPARHWLAFYAGATLAAIGVTWLAWDGLLPGRIVAALVTTLFGSLTALLVAVRGE